MADESVGACVVSAFTSSRVPLEGRRRPNPAADRFESKCVFHRRLRPVHGDAVAKTQTPEGHQGFREHYLVGLKVVAVISGRLEALGLDGVLEQPSEKARSWEGIEISTVCRQEPQVLALHPLVDEDEADIRMNPPNADAKNLRTVLEALSASLGHLRIDAIA